MPDNWLEQADAILEQLPEDMDELWTVALAAMEKGSKLACPPGVASFSLTRMKLWCPFLASERMWPEMMAGNELQCFIALVHELEFSKAKSIQYALMLLEKDSDEQQTRHALSLLSAAVLLFVAACADVDLDFANGDSVIEWCLPCVEENQIVPPLRRWMSYA
ncbi:MAG: hypothetical protein L3J33_07970 [Rhodobacteraceae bacterium]|nr:hypothetical protein [Paracoccaceae bacterium]